MIQATDGAELDVVDDPRHRASWVWADRSPPWSRLYLFALVVLIYAAGSKAALVMADVTGLDGVLFIPSGVTVAFLLRLSKQNWWIVLTAAGLTEFVMDLTSGLSGMQSLGFATANVAEPLLGASIVASACVAVDLGRRHDVVWYVLGAVLAGPALGALMGAVTDGYFGGDDVAMTFGQWLLGDALGVVLVATVILAWGSSPDRQSIFSRWGGLLIAGSIALTVAVVVSSDLPIVFSVLVGVVVAGVWFGVRAVAVTSIVIATAIALILAFEQGDLIIGLSQESALVLVKMQVAVFTLAGLFIAAESNERELATKRAFDADVSARASETEHRRVRDLTMRVQRGLLPDRLIKTEGIDIAARYEAASDALEVGGDWYDTISLGEGLFGVVVGDIVGHGIEAMTSMGRLRTALAALATHYDDPAELFSAVDEFVYTADDRQRYATVFYAIVDVDGPSIRYASAGHPPGLLVSPDGTCNWLDQGQSEPLVGHSVANRQSAEIAVDRGALLVLYSDGLIERRGESIATGLARLEAAAASFADGSAAEICELLIGELSLDQREDDAVVVAIKLETTPSEEFHETFPAEPEQLRQVRSSLGSWMETCDIPASVRNDLLISVGEATANIVRHAYHDVPALDMEVRVTRFDHVLGVQVADRGSWRFDADDDSHGMGTDIMRTITEGFQVDRTPSGTLVSFRVPIEGRRRGATGPGTDNGSDRPEHHGSARED